MSDPTCPHDAAPGSTQAQSSDVAAGDVAPAASAAPPADPVLAGGAEPIPAIGARSDVYIYGLCPAGESVPHDLAGVHDAPVLPVRRGTLCALVSVLPRGVAKVRPERRHLAAHQAVLRAFADRGCVLPMAFGMVLRGASGVKGLLAENEPAFLQQLQRVRGRVEMTLRLKLDVPNVFAHYVGLSADLRELRDRIASGRAGHEDKVEAGRVFERLLAAERDAAERAVHDAIADACAEILPAKPRSEAELVNFACLVERDAVLAFEAAVAQAAAAYDEAHAFELSGPWPAHSFVHIHLAPAAREAA